MRRRDWLAAAAGAALVWPARPARAAGPEPPPTSVEQALDQIETLVSPEALAAFYAGSEDGVHELRMGLLHLYLSHGWNASGSGKFIPSLAANLKARHAPNADGGYHYLLTALWRRKRGLPLDTPAIARSIERQERLRSERVRHWEQENQGGGWIDDREHFLWMPVVYFDQDSVRPQADGLALDYVVKTMQRPTSVCALAQVQGHASADEPDARALSLVRARAVLAHLVRRGIDPARLTAHGLGTRFAAPTSPSPPAKAPSRDRRVEIFCLRRHWVPPAAPGPAQSKGGADLIPR